MRINLGQHFIEAEKDGKLVSIDEVESGLSCGCICPACKGQLIARKGNLNEHHFAHYKSDCNSAVETVLHLKAKEIIAQSKTFTTPILYYPETPHVIFNEVDIPIDRVWLEKYEGCIKPDIIIESKGKKLLIEVVVTHGVDWTKESRVEKMGLPMVVIYADYINRLAYRLADPRGKEEFIEREIVYGTSCKLWVHNPFLSRIKKAIQDYADIKEVKYFKYKKSNWNMDSTYDAYFSYVEECPLEKDVWKGGKNKGKAYAKFSSCKACSYCAEVNSTFRTGKVSRKYLEWPNEVHCLGHLQNEFDEFLKLTAKNLKGK